MATTKGFSRNDFWSMKEIDAFKGAPFRFHGIMSKRRFDEILRSLQYTNTDPPAYKDGFHGVRQLIKAWNDNMANIFSSSWVS
jgi:Transposase IS4